MAKSETRFVKTVIGRTDDGKEIPIRYSVEVLVTTSGKLKMEQIAQRHLVTEDGHIVGMLNKDRGRFHILALD